MAHFEKECMVKELSKNFKDSSGLIVTNFDKRSVVDIDILRRDLEKHSSKLIVSKNTLLKLALTNVELADAGQYIDKATAIAIYKEDPVAVTKALFNFSKDHKNFKIRGGYVEGKLVSPEQAKELSELPGKDQLRAMVANRLQSPISGFVNVLAGTIRGLIVSLDQIKKQKEEQTG